MITTLTINGATYQISLPGDMPLLWALHDALNLTGPALQLSDHAPKWGKVST